MSKARYFGSQVSLFFSADGSTMTERLGEIDNFNAKMSDVLKENSSLGEAGVGSLDVLNDGGTLSFECKKSDSKLMTFFYNLQQQQLANKQGGKRGKTPYFVVKEQIEGLDGSIETTFYEGTVLYNLDKSVGSNKDEIVEKFEGRFKSFRVQIDGGDSVTNGTIANTFANLAIDSIAKLEASISGQHELASKNYIK